MSKLIKISDFISLRNTTLKDKNIVLVCGSFDLFHAGHLEFLQFSRSKGDILIVLLNSDTSIKKYKGKHRPIIKQRDRAFILQGLEVVNYIIIFNELTPEKYFKIIKPTTFCNGLDWGKNFIGIEFLKKNNTKIIYFKKKQTSASSVINKIIESLKYKENKYLFFDKTILSKSNLDYALKKFDGVCELPGSKKKSGFINYCNTNEIILNKSFYVGSNLDDIKFCKKINLRVIKISSKENDNNDGEDYNLKSISELKGLISSLNSAQRDLGIQRIFFAKEDTL